MYNSNSDNNNNHHHHHNNNNKYCLERTNWALAPVSQEHGLVHLLSRRWAFACLMMPFVLPLA